MLNSREIMKKLCFDHVQRDINVNCTYDNVETENSVTYQTKTIAINQLSTKRPALRLKRHSARFLHDPRQSVNTSWSQTMPKTTAN